ncbi:MAG: hypothetical protein R3C12_19635 [Planctomycetaceae bacterium]
MSNLVVRAAGAMTRTDIIGEGGLLEQGFQIGGKLGRLRMQGGDVFSELFEVFAAAVFGWCPQCLDHGAGECPRGIETGNQRESESAQQMLAAVLLIEHDLQELMRGRFPGWLV